MQKVQKPPQGRANLTFCIFCIPIDLVRKTGFPRTPSHRVPAGRARLGRTDGGRMSAATNLGQRYTGAEWFKSEPRALLSPRVSGCAGSPVQFSVDG